MDELLEQFLIEAREMIAQASDDLAALDQNPTDPKRINSALRAFHTLKGSTAIFDMAPVTTALHAAEDLLSAASKGRMLSPAALSALVACADQCDRWVDGMEATGALPADAPRDAVRLTRLLAEGGSSSAPPETANETHDWVAPLLQRERARLPAGDPLVAIRYVPDADCFFRGQDPLAAVAALPRLLAVHVAPRQNWGDLASLDPFSCNLTIEAVSGAVLSDVQAAFRLMPDQVELAETSVGLEAERHAPTPLPGASGQTVRVEAARIDRLVAMIGELSVAKNRLVHLADTAVAGATIDDLVRNLRAEHALLDRITTDLHEAVMGARTAPLQRIFQRLPRLARATAEQLGRNVVFEMSGGSTELDKTVADALFEPLLHLIRNAVDHGVEEPEDREKAGKPAQGRIGLSARRAGDQVEIDVSDDGKGIDPDRVRQIAVERGVVTAAAASEMDAEAAMSLIFTPGFSTASDVTNVSGRGVGMDAVRVAVERLGGRTTVSSHTGLGTTIRLMLPLSAVMTTVLTVKVGTETFGIPVEDIVEVVRLPFDRVVSVGQGSAFTLRDRTIPYVRLADLLGRTREVKEADHRILIARSGLGDVGVAVDGVSSRFNAMLRPMAGFLDGVPGVTGTTLLGDGSVLLVLHLAELIG